MITTLYQHACMHITNSSCTTTHPSFSAPLFPCTPLFLCTYIVNHREDALKSEVSALEARCQEAHLRHEELAAKLPETTGPLVRQLEALQAAASEQAAAWQHSERALMTRATEAEARAAGAAQKERVMKVGVVRRVGDWCATPCVSAQCVLLLIE